VEVVIGAGVKLGVSEGIGSGVHVHIDVPICSEGWNGVGVDEAFGSCVIKMKVEKTCCVGVTMVQEVKRTKSSRGYVIRNFDG
jgi:hypothetical protein